MFVRPEVIDRHFAWSPGRAQRLAKRGLLPHYVLSDGAVRFRLDEIEATVVSRGTNDQPDERLEDGEVSHAK